MIDVANESLVPLTKARDFIPGRPHLATIYRWFQTGVRGGVKLETVLVGGRRFTSKEQIQTFVDRLSGDSNAASAPRTSRQRKAAAKKANDELAAQGW